MSQTISIQPIYKKKNLHGITYDSFSGYLTLKFNASQRPTQNKDEFQIIQISLFTVNLFNQTPKLSNVLPALIEVTKISTIIKSLKHHLLHPTAQGMNWSTITILSTLPSIIISIITCLSIIQPHSTHRITNCLADSVFFSYRQFCL